MSSTILETSGQQWSLLQKISFRFVFLLILGIILQFNNGVFPLIMVLLKYPLGLIQLFIPWFAKNYLYLTENAADHMSGSGDKLYNYVSLLCIAIFSVLGTLIWSLADRKRKNYNHLYYWLTVMVRFYVGIMLVNYGLAKVIKSQFPSPHLLRLTQNYGDSSPMGLAWTFLGFSKGYNLFMGFAELMAALLFFRRTVALGAFLSLMTAANIMAINYFYDVPVKIVSTILFFFCLFLLAPNFGRMVQFFFKGKAGNLKMLAAPSIHKKWLYYTKYSFKYLLLAFVILTGVKGVLDMSRAYGDDLLKPPLYGAYEVDDFWKKNEKVSIDQWKQLLISDSYGSGIRYVNNGMEYSKIDVDTLHKKMVITFANDEKSKHHFTYDIPYPEHLTLRGAIYGDSVVVELTKKEFELTKRGFHWVSENPYNR